jgi:ABC-type nitrate/sulfonate/bicarbonate transport system permease component
VIAAVTDLTTAAAPAEAASAGRTPRFVGTRASGFAIVVLLLALWESSARFGWVVSSNWPPFTAIVGALIQGFADGELAKPLLGTLQRMMTGYASGCFAGIALGLLLGTVRPLRYVFLPLIEIMRPIPAPAIIPPLILFLGVDDALKIVIIALASFFPVFVNTMAGVSSVDDVLRQTARTFRIGWRRTVMEVVLPGTLPSIAAGMRTAISLSLVVAVIAEMIAGSAGMGYYIVQMQYALKPQYMYAAVICLAVLGYCLNALFLAVERRMMPWVGRS